MSNLSPLPIHVFLCLFSFRQFTFTKSRAMKKEKKHSKSNIAGYEPLVKSQTIAEILDVSSRHVLMLSERGEIPSYRFSRKCIRFRISEVMQALGVSRNCDFWALPKCWAATRIVYAHFHGAQSGFRHCNQAHARKKSLFPGRLSIGQWAAFFGLLRFEKLTDAANVIEAFAVILTW